MKSLKSTVKSSESNAPDKMAASGLTEKQLQLSVEVKISLSLMQVILSFLYGFYTVDSKPQIRRKLQCDQDAII